MAVRKNPLMSTATNKEIDGSIGEWLKKATTRIDNKKKKVYKFVLVIPSM